MQSDLNQLQNLHLVLETEKERLRYQQEFLQNEVRHVQRRLERATILQHLGLQHNSNQLQAELRHLEARLEQVKTELDELENELSARVELTIGHLQNVVQPVPGRLKVDLLQLGCS